MGTQIKEGEALVVGRGRRETAIALLKAADDTGHPVESVRTVMDGFLVPAEVADAYEEAVAEKERQEVRRFQEQSAEEAAAGIDDAGEAAEQPAETGEETVGSTGITETEAETVKVPAKSADKPTWVEFAKTQGYDESEDLTKDQLIERYGASE